MSMFNSLRYIGGGGGGGGHSYIYSELAYSTRMPEFASILP